MNNQENNSDTAIIIQGAIDDSNFVEETLKIYDKIFPNSVIILSTWENENIKNLNNLNLKNKLNSKTKLIGVTMLTSFNDVLISEIGIEKSVNANVKQLTQLAISCEMDGIVCSPLDISEVKNTHESKLQIISPGIRGKENAVNDQKRTLTAKEAIEAGADILVVGRPITDAKDPAKAAENIYSEIT